VNTYVKFFLRRSGGKEKKRRGKKRNDISATVPGSADLSKGGRITDEAKEGGR